MFRRKDNPYYLVRLTTEDLVKDNFTDTITWAQVKKGDLLIRGSYSEVINGKKKNIPGHAGVLPIFQK